MSTNDTPEAAARERARSLVNAQLCKTGSNRQQREREIRIVDQRTRTDREIAEQGRQDEILQSYLDQIGQLLLDTGRPLREAEEGEEVRTLARARTLTVLARLDGVRKGSVVQFLYESGLIARDKVIVDLKGADIGDADLSGVILSSAHLDLWSILDEGSFSKRSRRRLGRAATLHTADLSNVNLSGANLYNIDLFRIDLRGTDLGGAKLSKAFLEEAELSGADLSRARLFRSALTGANLFGVNLQNTNLSSTRLNEANLFKADLSGSDLSGATGLTIEQVHRAKSLKGATMPNGRKYEDWIKDQEGRQ